MKPAPVLSNFHGLTYQQVENSFHAVQLIRRGLMATDAINDYDPEDILEWIKTREAQCWGAFKDGRLIGIVVTRVLVFPKRKVLRLCLAAGERLDLWEDEGWGILSAYGASVGCAAMKGSGRIGWLRKLKNKGITNGCASWSIDLWTTTVQT